MAEQSADEKQPRKRRRFLKVVLWLSLLLIVAAGAGWLAFPHIVAARLHATLINAGFTEVDFDIENVSLSHITLSNVRLGEDERFMAPKVTASYTVSQVIGGRVSRLTVYDASWMAVVTEDGSLDISPWDELTTGDDTTGDPGLPFDELVLVKSNIELRRQKEAWQIPVHGMVTEEGGGVAGIDLAGSFDAIQGALQGEVAMRPLQADLKLALDLPQTSATTAASEAVAAPTAEGAPLVEPLRTSRLNLNLDYSEEPQPTLRVDVDGRGPSLAVNQVVSGANASVGPYAVSGQLTINNKGVLQDVDLRAQLAELAVAGEQFPQLQVVAKQNGDEVAMQVDGTYGYWRLALLEVVMPADVRVWLSDDNWLPVRWEVTGELPAGLRDLMAEQGITAPGLETVRLTGSAQVQLRQPAAQPPGEGEVRPGNGGKTQPASWALAIREGSLQLPVGDVHWSDDSTDAATAFGQVAVRVDFSGRASADGVQLALQPGEVATVGALALAGVRLVPASRAPPERPEPPEAPDVRSEAPPELPSEAPLQEPARQPPVAADDEPSPEAPDPVDDEPSAQPGPALTLFLAESDAELLPEVSVPVRPVEGEAGDGAPEPPAAGLVSVRFGSGESAGTTEADSAGGRSSPSKSGEPSADGTLRWEMTLPRLLVRSSGHDLITDSLRLSDLSLDVEAYVFISPESLRAVGGASMTAAKGSWAVGEDDATFAPVDLTLSGQLTQTGSDLAAEGEAELDAPLALAFGDWLGDVSRLTAAINWQQQGGPSDATVNMTISELRNPGYELSMQPINLGARLTWSPGGEQLAGAIDLGAGAVRYRGNDLPAMKASGQWRDGRLTMQSVWPVTAENNLRTQVVLETGGEQGWRIAAAAALPATPVTAEDPLGQLLRNFTDATFAGTVGLDAQMTVTPQGQNIEATAALRDGTLTGTLAGEEAESQWQIAGLTGNITLVGINPLQTPPEQRLVWESAKFGEVQLADGSVRYSLQSADEIRLSRLRMTLPDGGIITTLAPATFNPAKPDLTLQLRLEQVSLDTWIRTLSLGYVTGQGRVSGTARLRIATEPSLKVALGEGQLKADPGGNFQVVDLATQGAAVPHVQQTLENLDVSEEIQSRIKEALSDFQFEALRFTMIREGGDTTLQIHTSGKGRHGARQEIGGLTVNIHNYNELFDVAMRTRMGLERATAGMAGKLLQPEDDKGEDRQ